MTRVEHLKWCKERALEYVEMGDLGGALASMSSDLGKHPETSIDPVLAALGMNAALSNDRSAMRRWIEGFN